MSKSYEYTLSLNDKISGKMRAISGVSSDAFDKFTKLSDKTKTLQRSVGDFGGSIYNLKQKIDLLQQERDLIDPKNLTTIRQYNSEIKRLTKEVGKLETINGSKFKNNIKAAFNELPPVFKNPVVLVSAAAGFAVKGAMSYAENMAKVNITAQLDEKGLAEMSEKVKAITKKNRADINIAPVGLEKIISQTGDAALSLDILNSVQRGAKAGFVEMDVVSGALAQTLSIVGKENTNAAEVLDTFFAAKRVGAGEFADFARYMPGLIAGGSNLGIAYKEVAGVFAYMTGKGQTAEKSAVLMENAFSALGKSDIQSGLKKYGVSVFDAQGKMRSLLSIATDLKGVLDGKTDAQKTTILENIGLRDKEAKNAFAILTADVGKLGESLNATRDAMGETDAALSLSANPIQRATELWNLLKLKGVEYGEKVLPLINGAMSVLSGVLDGVFFVLDGVIGAFENGNPLIYGATAAFLALTVALNAATIATKAKALWDGILAAKTWLMTTAQWAMNAAMWANPVTWIVLGIGALVAVLVLAWQKCDWFRGGLYATWEAIKGFGNLIKEFVVDRIKGMLSGISGLGSALLKLFDGDFKGAWETAKQATSDLLGVDAVKNAIGNAKQMGKDVAGAYQKGVEDFNAGKETADSGSVLEKITPSPVVGNSTGGGYAEDGKSGKVLDLNKTANDLKGTTAYSAIASKLNRVMVPTLAAASLSAAVMLPSETTTAIPPQKQTEQSWTEPDVNPLAGVKTITVENITIHIANADGKGVDEIEKVVKQALLNVIS